ncbi:MAG TPA: hypothetical protein DIS74_09240 [Bacteroidales bacterium]|nr:hypothetical protein [Bacteroidales bacterium]
MKYLKTIIAILLAVTLRSVNGQNTVEFTYDSNGSRLSRTLEIVQLKSSVISFPVDMTDLEKFETTEKKGIQLFPNPFSSSLKLVINGFDESTVKDAVIFSVSGAELLRFQRLSNECEIQLSSLDDGVYIMRVTIDTEKFVYKIVKKK